MKLKGTIVRVQRGRAGVTLIIETDYGQRGIELDRELWADVLNDFSLGQDASVVGWVVEYDPAHGDLEINGPDDESDLESDEPAGENDHSAPE